MKNIFENWNSFVSESHSKEDEKELKKVSDELKGASKMHKSQADRIDKILDSTDDEELEEGKKKNCGCGQDPCITYGVQAEVKSNTVEEDSLEEDCQDGYERVPGSVEFAQGSCRKKTSEALTPEEEEEENDLAARLAAIKDDLETSGPRADFDDSKPLHPMIPLELELGDDDEYEDDEMEMGLEEKKKKKKGNKICDKGIAWAKRTFDTYPSAYANLAASKYCKDPNYGKGKKKKKNESLELEDFLVNFLTETEIDEGALGDWLKQKWKRIDSKGNVAGECGTSKDKKNPDRCLPASKASSLSKSERAATAKKKKDAQKSGKDSGKTSNVSNTKKAKVKTKESVEMNIEEQLKQAVLEELSELVYYHITDATYDDGTIAEDIDFWDDVLEEAEYQGRKVTLNKPMKGDVKKSKVYVKNAKGNVVKVNFGDKKMKIKKSNPKRRKSFRARHNCDNPGPKWKARYWSCKAW